MLEFGNVLRTSYEASVITSAYAASVSSTSGETEIQDIIEVLTDPELTSYRTSATGATEAISTVQWARSEAAAIQDDLEAIQAILEDLSEEGLTEEEQADLIGQVEAYAQDITDRIEANPFLGPEGEDLAISIGNGSSITVESQDLGISLDDVDLSASEGIQSFQTKVASVIEDAGEYVGYLEEQLDHLANATQIIEYAAENELGASTEDLDEDLAMLVASLAASQVIDDMSVLFGMQASLRNETVAALLADCQ